MRKLLNIRTCLCGMALTAALAATAAFAVEASFQMKLVDMLKRIDSSIKVLKEQISESHTAPFLPDLYLQLGSLHSQRSNVLYYIQMEREAQAGGAASDRRKLDMVVEAQKEAITVFQQLVKDFPNFPRREKALFLLASTCHSIEETTCFFDAVDRLLAQFPAAEESEQARVLLGQYWFEKNNFAKAAQYFNPVTKSSHAYERNLAKYKLGLIFVRQENHREALRYFEEVLLDAELKDDDTQFNVSLETKRVEMSLKREALVDSIQAYPHVYQKDARPVPYYSRLAPTEELFREAIEKLSFRYIYLKRFDEAIALLRVLSEMSPDPQRIVNIYQEVLSMIALKDRVGIKVKEIEFLLEKVAMWFAYFQIDQKTRQSVMAFLEKQIRELGTTSHNIAKKKEPDYQKYLARGREFYRLYLGFFGKSENAVKMATNLADVYYLEKDYLSAGDYYLRVYSGEFGPVTQKRELLQSALASLQADKEYTFYELLRGKGLMIRGIRSYMEFDPAKKKDEKLNYLLALSRYQQGQGDEAVPSLYQFMREFPASKYAAEAGELVLNHFNMTNDYRGLTGWAEKMLQLPMRDKEFQKRVADIRKKAASKLLAEEVKNLRSYDEFAQGRSYLEFAAAQGNSALASFALQQALAKSKAEKDLDTFLSTAEVMAKKEQNPRKKAEILASLAQENTKLTRFYAAAAALEEVLEVGDSQAKLVAMEQLAGLALLLKDWRLMEKCVTSPDWRRLKVETRERAVQALADAMESSIALPGKLIDALVELAPKNPVLLQAMYKSQFRLDSDGREQIVQRVSAGCGRGGSAPVCKWNRYEEVGKQVVGTQNLLAKAPADAGAIDKAAARFMAVLETVRALEDSGDAQLNIPLTILYANAYTSFGRYLQRAGKANPQIAQLLNQKAAESFGTARKYADTCRTLATDGAGLAPLKSLCSKGRTPSLKTVLAFRKVRSLDGPQQDPATPVIKKMQLEMFVGADGDNGRLLEIARAYHDQKQYRHAAAAAMYGMSAVPARSGQFRALLGCSVWRLGLGNEAQYHLKNADAAMKQACLRGSGSVAH